MRGNTAYYNRPYRRASTTAFSMVRPENMDNPSNGIDLTGSLRASHNVELFTTRFIMNGFISGPHKRISDMLNRRDTDVLKLDDASLIPVGLLSEPRRIDTPVIVGRDTIHFAAEPEVSGEEDGESAPPSSTRGREFIVRKTAVPCYVLTDTFLIYGQCYLHTGTDLDHLFAIADPFIPLTRAVIYWTTKPSIVWRRKLIVVNRNKIQAMYTAEENSENAQSDT
jgi:hypothetical protein